MTVAELIENLKELPQDAEVQVPCEEFDGEDHNEGGRPPEPHFDAEEGTVEL